MVDSKGFEPSTSRMWTERSLNWAASPYFAVFCNFFVNFDFCLELWFLHCFADHSPSQLSYTPKPNFESDLTTSIWAGENFLSRDADKYQKIGPCEMNATHQP